MCASVTYAVTSPLSCPPCDLVYDHNPLALRSALAGQRYSLGRLAVCRPRPSALESVSSAFPGVQVQPCGLICWHWRSRELTMCLWFLLALAQLCESTVRVWGLTGTGAAGS